jgi:integrase
VAKEPKVRADAREASSAVKEARLLPPQYITKLQAWAWAALKQSGVEAPIAASVLLLLGTAARRMELCAFKVKDFRAGSEGPTVCFRIAKGNKTGDTIPLTAETWQAYQTWLTWKRAHGESVEPNAPVFCGRPGEHMGLVTLWRHWKTALAAVGVPAGNKYGVHAARHAAAYLIFRATKDYAYVKRILRHESVKTTEMFYEHFNLEDLRAGMTKAGL